MTRGPDGTAKIAAMSGSGSLVRTFPCTGART
jgi:hypothetical protein